MSTLDVTRPYCLLHQNGKTTYAAGRIVTQHLLDDMPRPDSAMPVLSMIPFSQLRERTYLTHDGSEPIISLLPDVCREVTLADVLDPKVTVTLVGEAQFTPDDDEFARRVSDVVAQEIQRGEGSNFLISRRCDVSIGSFGPAVANTIFARLARNELGAYMTFCFFDGERFFIGSSPERHLTYRGGRVVMNPICGTLPRVALRRQADLLEFLADPKEINELFQVVDEELKMMSSICGKGGVVTGPFLKEMSALVHTEYELEGFATMDPVRALRESMFAATMVGSPLENAARVIHRHESESRRYYSSAFVVMGLDEAGDEYLDSAITIRTMEVDRDGHAVIRAGASIVRDSVPEKEAHETRAKAQGLLTAIATGRRARPYLHKFVDDNVREALVSRNRHLSRFWMDRQSRQRTHPALSGRSVLLIDNEDQFTQMLRHVLEHLGVKATVSSYREEQEDYAEYDLVLLGPGPGDPNDLESPKMARLHGHARALLEQRKPFLAVCLGHQVLCRVLGLNVEPVEPPMQGVQKEIDLFGRREMVGFYNTFFARLPSQPVPGVEFAADENGLVNAARGAHFISFQFHVESILTTNCVAILREALLWALTGGKGRTASPEPGARSGPAPARRTRER